MANLVERGHIHVAQPPLFRVDVEARGHTRKVYCLDEAEKEQTLVKLADEGIPENRITVSRFKGLGEMNPAQLRESTIHPDTRRLVQLTVDDSLQTHGLMDMLLAKKRAGDRKTWLEAKGDLASLEV